MLLWETVISILSSQITGRNEPNFNVNMYCILDEKKRCKSCNTNSSPCAPCIHTCVPTCYTWTVPTLDDSHLVREISDWCNDGPWSFGARGFNATQIYFSLTLFYTTWNFSPDVLLFKSWLVRPTVMTKRTCFLPPFLGHDQLSFPVTPHTNELSGAQDTSECSWKSNNERTSV